MIKVILVSFAITYGLRAVPFVLFGRSEQLPDWLEYLGKYLPPAIMACLVIYAAKNFFLFDATFAALTAGIVTTVAIHLWRRSTPLSIIAGTAIYMLTLRLL